MPLWRGQQEHVYHACFRCGTREPLSVQRWQNGLLLCKTLDCIDTAIVGSRDLAVAKEASRNRHELEPDRKLYTPRSPRLDLNEVPYSGG